VIEGTRRRLHRVAPPTSGRLGESRFLLAGATAGLVGWSGTQAIAWLDQPNGPLLATALWTVLIGGFIGLTVRHAPDDVRFSHVMVGWGTVNGTATALTVVGLAGLLPAKIAFWVAWAAAAATGYALTGALLLRSGAATRGRGYLGVALVAFAVLALGTFRFELLAPVAFLLLATLHAVPLAVDAETSLSPVARTALLTAIVSVVLGVGLAV